MRAPNRTAIMANDSDEKHKFALRRAAAALASRDFELASRLYKGLLKNDCDNRDLLFALGDVYVKSGDDMRAIAYYEKIISTRPNDVASLNALGGIYRRLERYDDSLRVLRTALSLGGKAEVNYNLGFTYRSMGDYDKAIDCFESVIASDPGDTLAYNHLGVIYTLRKEYQKAMTTYKRGLQVDPNHPVLQLNLAEICETLHADGEAAVAYEAALRAKPGWIEAVRKYAALLLRCHKTQAAESVVTKAIALHPSDAGLFALLGRIALKRFDYDAAVSALKKASALDPENTTVISSLADAYEKKGALENGSALIRQAENNFPSDAVVSEQYVRTLLSVRDYESAFAKLKALYAKNQNDVQLLDLYGQYCICREEYEKAAACYKKINSIDSQYFAYEKSAARRFLQTGRFGKARNFIARYLSKYPRDEEALVLSAEIDTAKGKLSSALDTYRAVLAVDDGNVRAKYEISRIEKLLKEKDGTKSDEKSDENNETTGAEIVMDSPETKAYESEDHAEVSADDDFFDFDLTGESILKSDDEIDPFTIADRESDEDIRDSEADGLDLLIPSDRPIDQDASAPTQREDAIFDGRTGAVGRIDESLSGNIEDAFDAEDIDAGFEAPIVSTRSETGRVHYEDEPISIAEDVPERRPLSEVPHPLSELLSKVPNPLSNTAEKEAHTEPASEGTAQDASPRVHDAHDGTDASAADNFSFTPDRIAQAEGQGSKASDAAARNLVGAMESVSDGSADELDALRRSYDEAHRMSEAAHDAVNEMRELIGSVKESVERMRADAEQSQSRVKVAAEKAVKEVRYVLEKALSGENGKSDEDIEYTVQKKSLPEENAFSENKKTPPEKTDINENVTERACGEGQGAQTDRDFNAALEKAVHALPDIIAALQDKKSAKDFAIELELFKKLRAMCDFLPEWRKETFMTSRTRLLLDYVIARLSGRPGLLSTAEVLRKINLPAELLENGSSFSELTAEQLVPLVIRDMRTKLADLPDASLAAALDAAASEALENAQSR